MGWKTLIVVILGVCSLHAADIVLQADHHDGKDNIWRKRYDAGKNTWGIVGNHEIESGSMWFDSFPGETGSYEVVLGIVAEEDGRPLYRVSAGETVLDSGQYPCPGGSCDCSSNTGPETINLGTHPISRGERIEVWGQSTYSCDGEILDHGAYTRWYEIRFKPVGGTPASPKISLAENSLTFYPVQGYIIPFGKTEVAVENAGEGTLPQLTAEANVDWLSASIGGSGNSQTVKVAVSQADLSEGEHQGSVEVSGPDLGSESIAVACTVSPIGTAPKTRMVSPDEGSLLRETQSYTLTGEGENLVWNYDANSDKKGKIKIGDGHSVDFVVPDGITGPRTISIFLDGENGSVERQFNLGIPTIRLISPNGGETFTSGETVSIEWEADTSIITDIDILYSTNLGVDWVKINGASSVTLDSPEWGSYPWKIPESVSSKNCYLRVEKYEASANAKVDISDGAFEIEALVTGAGKRYTTPTTSPTAGSRKLGTAVIYTVRGRRITGTALKSGRLPHGIVVISTEKGIRRENLRNDW